jgi:signal transduction histidine kinase
MLTFFRRLFESDFMPHGHCYFWQPEIVWLHVSSDALIALAYFCIPVTLVHLVRRRKDLAFNWMFVLFAVFILACGATHLMSIWTLWNGTYRIEGLIKAITALSSVTTAFLLVRLIPKIVMLPSPDQLRMANTALAAEIAERKNIEQELWTLNAELEERVRERTRELERSNQKLLETNAALERSNSDLNQFACSASHDLQEPLRTVGLYSELLTKRYGEVLDRKGADLLGHLTDAAGRMRDLMDKLLAYSHVAAGGDDPHAPTRCDEAVGKVLLALQVAIDQAGATITCGPLPELRVEEVHMMQLLQNLIANSVKYRSDRPVQIRVSAERSGDSWTFCVADNGIGIAPEYQNQIFGLFKRLHGNKQSGTGVGLALCKRIVERYGGRIWVESEQDIGSRFLFSLPA